MDDVRPEDCTPIFSIAVPVHLLKDREVSATAKLLYGVIESFQRKSGVCFASNDRLAEELGGCTPRTASKCVSELKNAGYIIVDDTSGRKIYLATSVIGGQGVEVFFHPPTKKPSRGGEETFQGGGRNLPPSISTSNTVSNSKKKTIDPLPVFVEWIQATLGDQYSSDDKNALYLMLVEYKQMRAETSSPLNTKRKVNGLLDDLLDGSDGDVSVMVDMLTTATRRCWLAVYPPDGKKKPAQSNEGMKRTWI